MSRIEYKYFEKGISRKPNVYEINLSKIILVEDLKTGGYTAFFKPDDGIISEGETKEAAVINLLDTYNTVLNSGNIKLNIKKILLK
jgi:predicted RNase H-like HicB family nuclease